VCPILPADGLEFFEQASLMRWRVAYAPMTHPYGDHIRNMDSISRSQFAHQEIVVGRNAEAVVESAMIGEQGSMMEQARVRDCHHVIKRPLQLFPGPAIVAGNFAALVYNGNPTVNNTGLLGRPQVRFNLRQYPLIPKEIVRTQKTDPVACAVLQRLVPRIIDTFVRDGLPKGELRSIVLQDLDSAVSGAAIHDDEFPIGIGLARNTIDALLNRRCAVVNRNDDRDARR
jgi:hypothetical protein